MSLHRLERNADDGNASNRRIRLVSAIVALLDLDVRDLVVQVNILRP